MTTRENWTAVNCRLMRAVETKTCPNDLLVAGPAGSGKTYGILDVFHCLLRDNDGLRVLAARSTRAASSESWMVTYEQGILPLDDMESLAHGVKRRVRQSYVYENGSELVVGGLDNPDRILSTEWDIVYINEAKEATEDAWETIRSRLSRPGRAARLGLLIGDTNPADPSHWLKSRVDRGLTTLWEAPHESNPAMFDGASWTEAGRRYRADLATLTGTRRSRLYLGLWAAGEEAWFGGMFDPEKHVGESAEYDPALPVHLAIDTGVFTGAVFYQTRDVSGGPVVTVFGEYLSEGRTARQNAGAIQQIGRDLCDGKITRATTDPAGGARNPLGPTVILEYKAAGLPLVPWETGPGSVLQGLSAIEALLSPGDDVARLVIHPRCKQTIAAVTGYRRAKRGGQWQDYPEDPQHPYEDLMDALRGGIYRRVRTPRLAFYG
jgi:hypothetical protein